MAKLRSVSVVFQAFTDKFEKAIDRAGGKMTDFSKNIAGAVGGFLAAKVAVGNVTRVMEDLIKLGDISKNLQVSPDFVRGLKLAAEEMGESFEGAQDLVKEFNIRMGEARTGAGPALEALKLLGMEMSGFNDMSPEQSFLKVVDALSKVEDAQVKIFAAGDLFGGKGEDMLNILNKGAEGLRKKMEEARKFGGPISEHDINAIREANGVLKQMRMIWDRIITQLLLKFKPFLGDFKMAMLEIVKIVEKLGGFWKKFQDKLEAFIIKHGLHGLGKGVGAGVELGGDGSQKTTQPNTTTRPLQVEQKKPVEFNLKSFTEAAMAQSSAAFNALNPNRVGSVQQENAKANKETAENTRKLTEGEIVKLAQWSIRGGF